MSTDPTARYPAAREFLEQLPGGTRVCVSYHGDADGTASAVLALRYLERTGRTGTALAPWKGEDLYTGPYPEHLRATQPEALLVLDQGSRSREVLPGVPTLVLDHHAAPSEGVPVTVYLSGLDDSPVPSASIMTWRLLSPLADLEDSLWLAAVGALGDLGADAPFPEVAEAKRQYRAKPLTETVALVNAAKRSAAHDTALSLAALLAAESPADVAQGRIPQGPQLSAYRAEVQAERTRCSRTAPRIVGDWALLRFASACQVHGPVATAWTRRLPKQIVIAANEGYTPGNVHFSVRTARPGEDLVARLRAFREEIDTPELGQGHTQASGGILPLDRFERLLAALGFSETAPARLAA